VTQNRKNQNQTSFESTHGVPTQLCLLRNDVISNLGAESKLVVWILNQLNGITEGWQTPPPPALLALDSKLIMRQIPAPRALLARERRLQLRVHVSAFGFNFISSHLPSTPFILRFIFTIFLLYYITLYSFIIFTLYYLLTLLYLWATP
jgi:hypothetical protein